MREKGFSFVEVLFSIMLLGIGLILIAAIFPLAAQQQQITLDESVARATAQAGVTIVAEMATTANMPKEDGEVHPLGTSSTGGSSTRLWSEFAGNTISAANRRYAWTGFIKRDPSDSKATVVVIALAQPQTFGDSDLMRVGGKPANLQPQNVAGVTVKYGSPSVATFKPGDSGAAAAAEGAFLVMSSGNKVYRLGAPTGKPDTWELMPGYDMASAAENLTVDAYLVGRGYKDPKDPTKGFDGYNRALAMTTGVFPVKQVAGALAANLDDPLPNDPPPPPPPSDDPPAGAIQVAADGDDAQNGVDAPVQTAERGLKLLVDGGQLLFRRGDAFVLQAGLKISQHDVVIGAYGTGEKAKLVYSGGGTYQNVIATDSDTEGVTITDLILDSVGSSDKEAATGVRIGGKNITVKNCEFRNLADGVNLNRDPINVLIQDNTAPLSDGLKRDQGLGIHGYFAWIQGQHITVSGNVVANSGLHSLRATKFDDLNIIENRFSQLNQWSALKIHDGTGATVARNVLTTSCDLEIGPLSGADGVSVNPNTYKTIRTSNTLYEGNQIKLLNNASLRIFNRTEHLTVRDNMIDAGDAHVDVAINIEGYNSTFEAGVVDITIANNTIRNAKTTGRAIFIGGNSQLDKSPQITLDGNHYIAPALIVPGAYCAALVYVSADDASMICAGGSNVWPRLASAKAFQVGTTYNGSTRRTLAQWNAIASHSDRDEQQQ